MTGPVSLPDEYAATLREVKDAVTASRFAAQRRVNSELVQLY
jgi:hypothetical protein